VKINLAKHAGFCFGVKRAIKIAMETAAARKHIEMLGDIVHNNEVIKQIEALGIKKISRLCANGKEKTLLIRAHGSNLEIYKQARERGYGIIDATCPMVKEIHRIAAKMDRLGYTVIVIGDKDHDEVKGILGQLKKSGVVVDTNTAIYAKRFKKIKKAAVVVQSTQNTERVLEISNALAGCIDDLKFFNTICQPTRQKQEEIRQMPKQNDVIIIIGSRESANTRRLYEISHSLNQRTYWIQSPDEIKPGWFGDAGTVGITAGASTPENITNAVITRIQNIRPEGRK